MPEKQKKIEELEKKIQSPNVWKNPENAAKISKEISQLKEKIEKISGLENDLNDIKELRQLAKADENLQKEIEQKQENLKNQIKKEEFQVFLSGKYDRGNAILEIRAGAGGVDAQDWATMLLRMFERYCVKSEFQTKILHQSLGEGGGPEGRIGTKSVAMEVKGNYAYGILKNESGVHRLVRISPFSAQKLRHTSFAAVEVLPEIEKSDEKEIEIKPEDLKIELFRSSGPGGQNVNKRETAVRLIHLPTGISATSQIERSQAQNRENAMKILYAKIFLQKEQERKKEIKEAKKEAKSASWSNQIRSYVLHPYKMVKDHRTDVETSGAEKVLDGDLDEFIEKEVKI